MRVGRQVSCCALPLKVGLKPREMRVRRLCQVNVGQSKPALDSRRHVAGGKWPRHNLATGGQTDEAKQRSPREVDALRAR